VDRKIDYRILGSFEVRVGGRLVGLGGEKPRALLAILLLHRNEVVSVDRLVDDLWGESPPETALRTVRAYVSRLRKALGASGARAAEEASAPGANHASRAEGADRMPDANGGVLLTQGRGYVLRVAPGEVDLERFAEMAERGRDALAGGSTEEASAVLREALGLWRGAPLAEFAYEPFAQSSIAQFEELRLAAVEDRMDADLALGHSRELVGELRDLVARQPLRERLRGQLMLALYRSGRQAEALEAFQEFRRNLAEEFGLDPGPPIRQLELAILARDPGLDPPTRAGGPAVPPAAAPAAIYGLAWVRARRLWAAVGAVLLLVLVVVGAIVRSSGGGAAAPAVIRGDSVGAISASGGAVRAVVPLGTSPSALAGGNGAVWTANYNQGTVSRIDVATRARVQTIGAGTTPAGLAVGAGAVWVTNNYGGTVSRIDPAVDRVVQTIPVGNAPVGVAVGYGSVWVANSSDGTLTRIDALRGKVKDTVALGAGATDVAAGAGAVWVSDEAGDRVFRVDPKTDRVSQVLNVGTGPTSLAVGFGSVWVANSLDGTVSRIDPQTNTVRATVAVGDDAGAVVVGGGGVWVSSQYTGTVARIDPVTDVVTRTIRVGNRPQGLAVVGGLVWVGARAVTGHRGGTLRVLTTGNADTMDPLLTQNLLIVLPMTYDGLTAYQRVGGSGSVQLVPDLAVSLPSPTDGGTTYTFQLRRGIRFSNGELVRPEDFRRALERELVLGGNGNYGGPFADVVGGGACAANPRRCDLSRGVVTDDAANTVTFHLVAPNPEFLQRLTLLDAVAVPAETPLHDIGPHPLPTTGPYEWVDIYPRRKITLVRNPYFREWSHAARPDGYPDRIVFTHVDSAEAGLTAIEHGSADYIYDGVPRDRLGEAQTRFASRLYITPTSGTTALILNTRLAPFTDARVRRAINYAIDRARIAELLGQDSQPACQILPVGLPGHRPYCPYTIDPSPGGGWQAPDFARAQRLIAASGTRGTPITVWNLGYWTGVMGDTLDRYMTSLLHRLGYPTHVKDFSIADPTGPPRFADSRTGAQAAFYTIPLGLQYPSASQVLQADYACQAFVPDSTGNPNWSEFCDHRLDAQISSAVAAESNNSPNTAALWARADRTATDQAPAVPLTTITDIHLVSARVGNYQYSFQQGALLDQLWVR